MTTSSKDTPRQASFTTTMKAILCAFIGIRKGQDPARDTTRLNPIHVVIAGLLGVAIFITILISIVHAVVSS